MKAGLMLNCDINRVTTFDKKSYYYPDLPAAYQTTQWFAPVAINGRVDIETSQGPKSVRIKQIHMEEDAGKLVHDILEDTTHIDFNRTSVPLIEIVSQPDFSSAEEVVAYLERLRSLLRFAKVSDCRWEQGSMRCDVNLSVRPEGSDVLGVRTEMKNMNSLSAIERAIEYETARHIDAIENGTEVLVYSQPSISASLAEDILREVTEITGLESRGVKSRPGLYVLRKTNMPATLVELGFITNPSDARAMRDNPSLFARGIYQGLLDFLNL
jgi:aspartyl/glutamyl-tRNA(Asn/Gln) amidotransferase B subunit